ncbi:hypothetical protein V3C99_016317 [Haemonchus contortus]
MITTCISTAIINYRNRDCFHPFFCTLLSLFLLSYALSDLFEIAYLIGRRYNANILLLDDISEFFYFYASPCAILLLIERFVASWFSMQYEKARPWKIFWIAQPICLLISYAVIYSAKLTIYSEDDIQTAILLVIQVLIAVIAILLLIYNRWRTKNSLGVGTNLSTRYQLAENIRVLKIIVPVIFFDLSLTICDIVSRVMHTIAQEMKCTSHVFDILYVTFKFLSFLFQLCIPLSVLFFHPVFQKFTKICNLCQSNSRGSNGVVIRNVLGTVINEDHTADKCFVTLQKRWEKT